MENNILSEDEDLSYYVNLPVDRPKPSGRPALSMMEGDQLKNLDRVLTMNRQTVQHINSSNPPPPPLPQVPQMSNLNPYMLQMSSDFLPAPTPQSSVTPPSSDVSTPSPATSRPLTSTSPSGPPNVPYWIPFWTGCPLPFSPMAYPQIIVPQQPLQHPVGPQFLRPVQFPPVYAPTVDPSTESREKKLDRYRAKRAKRKWSRSPDPRLSTYASTRARDENGKFIKVDVLKKTQEYEEQLQTLQNRLVAQEHQSRMLIEKLNATERELNVLKKSAAEDKTVKSVTPSDAFKEKIDLTQKRQDLRQINSPWITNQQVVDREWAELEDLLNECEEVVVVDDDDLQQMDF
eukprot:TRINITY_DN4906_c0_g1_i1.p1 TRINITY_DN4906_c0_g1~~TRINITY_DN4906_c0_g1_i1.p1  ORF type:complete len:346 (+),score=73.93 TRINITY_DN4906_c0_g1_i1:266-1303(+)